MYTKILQWFTGRLLQAAVNLHIYAIEKNAQKYLDRADAAALRTDLANADVRTAKHASSDALSAYLDARAEANSAVKAAHDEIAGLPSINRCGTVRSDPPFGSAPVVIDKRKP